MLNLNYTLLQAVADQALIDAAAHPRWVAAIGRALVELDTNPYIEWTDGHLLIASPSGVVYAANGICQCQAFIFGQPCWHRAAARLVRRYHEAQEAAQRPQQPPLAPQVVCQQPDNLCELYNPCPEHAPVAAAYVAQEATLTRKIAAARATALVNELFA